MVGAEDQAIYRWRGADLANVLNEAALLAASPDYTRNAAGTVGMEARYAFGRVDLNGDGITDILGAERVALLLLDEPSLDFELVRARPIASQEELAMRRCGTILARRGMEP